VRLLPILAVVWLLGTCRSAPPEIPRDFNWITFTSAAARYTVEVPNVYRAVVEDSGRVVFFRWRGTVPVKIYLTDLESAERHGLWVGKEPTGPATLSKQPGTRYDYTHCDGPFCSRMISFVIARGDRWLALEFRSEGELNPVNQHSGSPSSSCRQTRATDPPQMGRGGALRLERAPSFLIDSLPQ